MSSQASVIVSIVSPFISRHPEKSTQLLALVASYARSCMSHGEAQTVIDRLPAECADICRT
jgi:hypothetical protein